jgi:hypothetical protein
VTKQDATRRVQVGQLRMWAQDVLDAVQVKNVRLKTLRAESSEQVRSGPYEVTTLLTFEGLQLDDATIETASRYAVTCRMMDEDTNAEPEDVWSIHCDLRVTFGVEDPGPSVTGFSADQLDAFAAVIGVMHAHPYAREAVQSTTGRMGYPPFTLDLLMPISARPDDELIEFEQSKST